MHTPKRTHVAGFELSENVYDDVRRDVGMFHSLITHPEARGTSDSKYSTTVPHSSCVENVEG